MPLTIAGGIVICIRCTHAGKAGKKSHTILLMISSDTNVLTVHVDDRSHEEASKGISSAG